MADDKNNLVGYDRKNSIYLQTKYRRDKALDLYHGGERVEGNITLDLTGRATWSGKHIYLVRHPYETDVQWNIRKCRSTYANYCAPIVDLFSSFINENRPTRILPEQLGNIELDCDRLGSSANSFFANITNSAAAGGIRFVLVDMEPAKGVSKADDIAENRRQVPYFISIDPDDVYDWYMDEKGLAWVSLHSVARGAREFGADEETIETMTLWTRTEWRRWRRVMGTKNDAWLEDGGDTHALGEVPLVPFCFETLDYMRGLPVTDDVLSLALRVFRRDSELDKMLFDRAVPLLVVNGISQESWEKFVVASSNALMSSEPNGIQATYTESTGASFQAVIDAIHGDEARIREIALRMVRPQSSVGESAEAKKIDGKHLDTQLASFARDSASAEEHCWRLAAKWLGLPDSEIKAPYQENYDVKEAASAVVTALLSLSERRIISKAAVLRSEAVQKMLPSDFDEQENSREIEQEAKDGGGRLSLQDVLDRAASMPSGQ